MIACLDVAYGYAAAYASGLTFERWVDANALEERVVQVSNVQAYEPGQFFRRELPCLLAILKVLPPVDVVIVDGYVWLGGANKPGLGAHLYQALGERTFVVGIAKTKFKGANSACEVVRGRSTRPLFITAAGMSPEYAAEHVRSMHGPYRIPTLLKRADVLCRKAQAIDAMQP
jgi:deoxyribonuclease V